MQVTNIIIVGQEITVKVAVQTSGYGWEIAYQFFFLVFKAGNEIPVGKSVGLGTLCQGLEPYCTECHNAQVRDGLHPSKHSSPSERSELRWDRAGNMEEGDNGEHCNL